MGVPHGPRGRHAQTGTEPTRVLREPVGNARGVFVFVRRQKRRRRMERREHVEVVGESEEIYQVQPDGIPRTRTGKRPTGRPRIPQKDDVLTLTLMLMLMLVAISVRRGA